MKGSDVLETDEYLFIDGNGIGNFKKSYKNLQEGLMKPKYQQISKLLGLKSSSGPNI